MAAPFEITNFDLSKRGVGPALLISEERAEQLFLVKSQIEGKHPSRLEDIIEVSKHAENLNEIIFMAMLIVTQHNKNPRQK